MQWWQQDASLHDKDFFAPVWAKLAWLVQKRTDSPIDKDKPTPDTNDTQPNQDDGLHPDVTQGTLSLTAYNELVQWARVFGNTDASLVLVVFCDYAVGYCKDLHDSGSIYDYQKILNNELALMRRPFPKSPTSDTLGSHRAYLCAEKTASEDQLVDFQKFLFADAVIGDDLLIDEAESLGIPWFAQCFTKESTSLTTEIQTSREYTKNTIGLRSLPTLLVYNTNSAHYYKIPGRYELEEIKETFETIYERESK